MISVTGEVVGGETPKTEFTYHYRARYYSATTGRFLQMDPIGYEDQMNLYTYVGNDPVNLVDPSGTDAVAIGFPNYKITIGSRKYGSIGHTGILLINPESGHTRYYEFGRYPPTRGVVRNVRVPNVTMGRDGRPTSESLAETLKVISSNAGAGGAIKGAYFADADFAKMESFASRLNGRTSDNRGYGNWSVFNCNCNTFVQDTLESGGIKTPWMVDPRPNSYINELQV